MKFTKPTWAFLALCFLTTSAFAQQLCPPVIPRPEHPKEITFDKNTDCRTLPNHTAVSDCAQANLGLHIYHLQNATQQNDANEILVAIRNAMDPATKMFLIASTGDIMAYTYPAEADRIAEIIHALDRPHQVFRITYTFIDADSGDKTFPQAALTVTEGQNAILKRGEKVPIITESAKVDAKTPTHPATTYLDVGLMIDTTVSGPVSRGVSIKYRLEQSALAETSGTALATPPTVHQTYLNGITTIPIGKSTAIGTVELPGSKRRVVISAMAETIQ